MIDTIEAYTQMTDKSEGVDNPNLTLRLKEPEIERLKRIMAIAADRGGSYAKKSNIYRELLGLAPPRYLRQAEIEYFRTGVKTEGLFKEEPVAPKPEETELLGKLMELIHNPEFSQIVDRWNATTQKKQKEITHGTLLPTGQKIKYADPETLGIEIHDESEFDDNGNLKK